MALHRLTSLTSVLLVLSSVLACSAPGSGSDSGNDSGSNGDADDGLSGDGDSDGDSGNKPGGGSGECGKTLPVLYRDFKGNGEAGGHTDFQASARGVTEEGTGKPYEGWNQIGCGLVQPTLDANRKPIPVTPQAGGSNGGLVGSQKRLIDETSRGCYTEHNTSPDRSVDCNVLSCVPWTHDGWDGWFFKPGESSTQHWGKYAIQSAQSFSSWFSTQEGVNIEIEAELPLAYNEETGISVFDSSAFFPIDNQGWGNTPGLVGDDGLQHNFHFTTEIHIKFEYSPGQKFSFRGDDDLWIFVDGKLALDLGGQHQALRAEIDFDTLGLVAGREYNMDIFHAERQSPGSNFRIETNISCFVPVPVVR